MANIPAAQIPNVQTAVGASPMAPASAVRTPNIQRMPVLGREVFDGVGAGMVGLSRGVWEGAQMLGDFANKMSALNDQAQIADADRLMSDAIAQHSAERMTMPESEWLNSWNTNHRPKLDEAVKKMPLSMEGRAKLLNFYTGKQAAYVADLTVQSQKSYIERSLTGIKARIDRAKLNDDYEGVELATEAMKPFVSEEELDAVKVKNETWRKQRMTEQTRELVDSQMRQRFANDTYEENAEFKADLENAINNGTFKTKYLPALNGKPAELTWALKNLNEIERDSTIDTMNEAVTGIAEGQYGTVDELREDYSKKLDTLNMQKLEATFNQSPEEQSKRLAQRPRLITAIEMFDASNDPQNKEFDRLLAWIHSMPSGYQADLSDMLRDKKRNAQPKPSSAIQAIKERERQLFEDGQYGPIDNDEQWQASKLLQSRVIDKLDSWARANPKEAADSFEVSAKHNEIKTQIYMEDMGTDQQSEMQRPAAIPPDDLSRRILRDPRFSQNSTSEYEDESLLDAVQLPLGDGSWQVTPQTRDQIKTSSRAGQRQVSLDFNSGVATSRGVEIVIPHDATPEERAAAQAYVDKTVAWYRSKGIEVPKGRVLTKTGKGDKVSRFHTEPFYVQDSDAMAAVQNDPDGYAAILEDTLGRLSGVTFIAPHKTKDGGAQNDTINERDFARSYVIPALQRRKGEQPTLVAQNE